MSKHSPSGRRPYGPQAAGQPVKPSDVRLSDGFTA